MASGSLRIGAVSYLNTKPLVFGLRERLAGVGRLSFHLPSRLADELSTGTLAVALIPSIEYFRGLERGADYRIVSDAAITCSGPVWSVRLMSRVPIAQIRSIALDVGSRTSAALVQLLLRRAYGVAPRTVPLGMERAPEAAQTDAILLIGDRAMYPPQGVFHEIVDLGQWWKSMTGLPFVFAMWVARGGIDIEPLGKVLEEARDCGVAHLREIAEAEAGKSGLTVDDLFRYFRENLHFEMGPQQWEGLRAYHEGLIESGLISQSPAVTAG